MSASVLARPIFSCRLIKLAACCSSRCWRSASGYLGFTSTAIGAGPGTSWCRRPRRLASNADPSRLTPVRLPPGRLKLAMRPAFTFASGIPRSFRRDRETRYRGVVVAQGIAVFVQNGGLTQEGKGQDLANIIHACTDESAPSVPVVLEAGDMEVARPTACLDVPVAERRSVFKGDFRFGRRRWCGR